MERPLAERTTEKTLQRLDIFISSPGDVHEERQIAIRVINRFNQMEFIADRYVLRPLAYEERVPAAVGQRPQTTVDRYMMEAGKSDIFICILCHRMGTPVIHEQTGEQFESGTEYEFIDAYRTNQKFGKPYILLYRCSKPTSPDTDQEQFSRVNSFFKRFHGQDAEYHGIYKTYQGSKDFEEMLFHDLDLLISKNLLVLESDLSSSASTHSLIQRSITREDLREAPHIEQFYGREIECSDLKQWIVVDHCRIVAVLGMGGIGKTALVANVTAQVKDDFDYIYWRSLQNAPSLKQTLQNCIHFISDQQRTDLPENIDSQISLLLEYLQEHRCLIVLDNVESVLQAGFRAGQYREGYAEYGTLLQRVGEAKHQSCLLLTSREKMKEVARLEGKTLPVRSLQLSGIGLAEGWEILQDKGLFGSDEVWANLIHLYSGNPLALKLVSETIQTVFEGDIATFLKEGEVILGDMQDLLDQQFHRLSDIEQAILYWLAIEREVVSLNDLRDNLFLLPTMARGSLLDSLDSLRRRSMIETRGTARFALQPVIMEYVISVFVEQIYSEIETEAIGVLASHALIKAQAKDHIRDTQVRFILAPLAERLLPSHGKTGSEQKLKSILSKLHQIGDQRSGYAAGNVLNLLIQLQCDLRGYDFSNLTIWQAYLQDVALPDVNFANADLTKSVFTGTFEGIIAIGFSPSGELLAAGMSTGEIWIWQAPVGIPLLTCRGHTDLVTSVAFNPDGKFLASGSDDHTIRLWDTSSGNCVGVLQGHANRVHSVAFSPDGKLLASSGDDQFVKLWNTATGDCLYTLQGHHGWIRSIAFSRDGKLLASGSDDHSVRIWETSTRNCLYTLRGHTTGVISVTFSPKGAMLASVGADQAVLFWDINTSQPLSILPEPNNRLGSIVFSPDGEACATCYDGHTIRLWAVSNGKPINTIKSDSFRISVFAFSPNGAVLASGGDDQTIQFWEISSGQCLKTMHGYSNWMKAIIFKPDGKLLASCSDDEKIRLWDVITTKCVATLQGHAGHIRSIAFSPDGQVLASSSDDQTIRLWDVITGRLVKILQGHGSWVWTVSFSPDGKFLASGSYDQTVRLWEVSTGQCFKILEGHTSRVRSVAFIPDGSIIASGSDDQTIRFWEVSTGRSLKVLQGHTDWVWAIAFSPDGHNLASGSGDKTIRMWDSISGESLHILHGHTDWVRSLAFSPDGYILASCSHDGTIKLWDVPKAGYLQTLRSDRPYERMNITGVSGLTETQKASLIALGAIQDKA